MKIEIEKSNIKASIQLLESNKTKHEQRMGIVNQELSLLQTYANCISSVSLIFILIKDTNNLLVKDCDEFIHNL